MLFAADESDWTPWSRRQVVVRSDSMGNFTVSDVPTGDYLIVAVPVSAAQGQDDVNLFRRFKKEAMPVTLSREVSMPTVDLRIAG
jgi:hypothetical protein